MTSPSSRFRPARRRPLTWLATLWTLTAAVVSAVGTVAALYSPGPLVSFVVAGMLGLVAGGFTFAFGREDLAGLRRALRAGSWFAGATVVTIGLGGVLGGWSALLLAVLLVTCPLAPAAVRLARRRRGRASSAPVDRPPVDDGGRSAVPPGAVPVAPVETVGGVDMTRFELALLDADDGSRPMHHPDEDSELGDADLDDLCRMWRRTSVLLRQRLDSRRLTQVLEARQRCLDELLRRYPAGTRAWLDAAGTRADDPRPYLFQRPEAI